MLEAKQRELEAQRRELEELRAAAASLRAAKDNLELQVANCLVKAAFQAAHTSILCYICKAAYTSIPCYIRPHTLVYYAIYVSSCSYILQMCTSRKQQREEEDCYALYVSGALIY